MEKYTNMRLNYKVFIVLAFLLEISGVYGQQIKPLGIGDSLPDFIIPKIINSERSSGRTSDYKDKLLILDFWSTKCSSCIEGMPRLSALQKRFGDKIKILPVTYENSDKIIPFWKNNKYTKGLALPTVVEDELLDASFPHHGVPHEAWVYKGKVIGITSSDYVDVANIQRVINGEQVSWMVRYDSYKFDYSKPLFHFNSSSGIIKNQILQYAAISDYKSGVNYFGFSGGRGIVRNIIPKTVRLYWLNEPIYNSYLANWVMALGNQKLIKPNLGLDSNQVIWEVTDRSKYMFNNKYDPYLQEWLIKNGICFESIYPDSGQTDMQVYRRAISDLDKLLGLYVRWEKRREKVWVLKENSTGKLAPIKRGTQGIGTTTGGIATMFNNQGDHCYVFNETMVLPDELWMDIKLDPLSNLAAINSAIAAYGLIISEEERYVDKLIFSEKK